jgi:Tol biopolymer transport system component
MSLLQVLHWFNPLVWVAFYRMQSDRELACDALVLSYTHSGESKEYGRTIVSLLERFSRPQRLPSMAGILENKSQLKRRIKMIAKFKKTSRTRWTGAMLLLVALACIVLTNAYVAKADFEFGMTTSLGQMVNSGYMDFYPTISADGLSLYFTSDRPGGYGDRDLWVTARPSTSCDWESPLNLGPNVNSSSREQSSSISRDGLEIYFSSGRQGGFGSGDLWISTRAATDDPWGTPVNLGQTVNSPSDDHSPSISADGLSLYFASNRSGGYGNYDIWLTTRVTISDLWQEPVNLGPNVNTQSGDSRPSISQNGLTLFFGSTRPGLPGYRNIYVARRATTNDEWNPAVGLGTPVNGGGQNSYPSISADGSTLYFATDRSDSRGDIWQVKILPVVDLNGDGKVDLKDLRKLAQYWGQDEPSCDIAPLPFGDGIVDDKDLMVLAEYMLKELQPVAHWKLDESEGNVAEDSIGNNDGTLHGNPTWQPTEGMVNGAIELDGIDDYISTPFILDPAAGSFSAFAWVKGGARGQMIISQKDISDGRNTQLGCAWLWADPSYGRLMTWLMHPPFDPLVSEIVITDDHWHHVGLVYDLDALYRYLYVDGVEVAKDTEPVGGVDSNGGLYFGASKTLDANAFWSGLIDDVRIYDEVLSAEEVADLARQ